MYVDFICLTYTGAVFKLIVACDLASQSDSYGSILAENIIGY